VVVGSIPTGGSYRTTTYRRDFSREPENFAVALRKRLRYVSFVHDVLAVKHAPLLPPDDLHRHFLGDPGVHQLPRCRAPEVMQAPTAEPCALAGSLPHFVEGEHARPVPVEHEPAIALLPRLLKQPFERRVRERDDARILTLRPLPLSRRVNAEHLGLPIDLIPGESENLPALPAGIVGELHDAPVERGQLQAEHGHFTGLARLNRELVGKAEAMDTCRRTVLDMDSTEIPVYGEQEEGAHAGHFESPCFHPLLLFNSKGDCLANKLRPGNVHSANGWEELLLPEIGRQQTRGQEVGFRADAAFAEPEIYEGLENRGRKYAIRMPANESLERDVVELLPRG
jgi:Transposase DDE domain group 1